MILEPTLYIGLRGLILFKQIYCGEFSSYSNLDPYIKGSVPFL